MTKSYVIKFDDLATTLNDKNETMEQQLLKKFDEYGSVEPLETYIAKHDEQWQTTVNGIKNEYNKLKGVACQNENELALVRAYRAGVKAEISTVEAEKEKLRGTLVETQTNLDNLKTIIKNAVGE